MNIDQAKLDFLNSKFKGYVSVYYNLHDKIFSVKYKGIVIGYTDKIFLKNCNFSVSQSGRLRVLKERKKNVHAYIRGYFSSFNNELSLDGEVSYNPYKYEYFYHKNTLKPVNKSDNAFLSNKKAYI